MQELPRIPQKTNRLHVQRSSVIYSLYQGISSQCGKGASGVQGLLCSREMHVTGGSCKPEIPAHQEPTMRCKAGRLHACLALPLQPSLLCSFCLSPSLKPI